MSGERAAISTDSRYQCKAPKWKPHKLGRILIPPPKARKRSAAVCGAPAAAIGASGTLRSFHHGLAFGGAAAGPSDTAAPGQCRDAPSDRGRDRKSLQYPVTRFLMTCGNGSVRRSD